MGWTVKAEWAAILRQRGALLEASSASGDLQDRELQERFVADNLRRIFRQNAQPSGPGKRLPGADSKNIRYETLSISMPSGVMTGGTVAHE